MGEVYLGEGKNGGVYLREGKNGGSILRGRKKWGSTHLRPKAARNRTPPPSGCFWRLPLQNFKLPKNVKIAQKRKNVFFKHQFKKYIIIM